MKITEMNTSSIHINSIPATLLEPLRKTDFREVLPRAACAADDPRWNVDLPPQYVLAVLVDLAMGILATRRVVIRNEHRETDVTICNRRATDEEIVFAAGLVIRFAVELHIHPDYVEAAHAALKTTDLSASSIHINSKPAGLFHGHEISEANVQAAAETLWNETYGTLADLRDGMTYWLHLYPDDGDCVVKLEDSMTEVRSNRSIVAAPVIRHRAELPEWADGSAAAQETMDENSRAEFIEAWADEIRANLDPIDTQK